MLKFIGKGVCSAVAVGPALVFKKEEQKVRRRSVSDSEEEILRFSEAKKKAERELEEIYKKALNEVGEANAEIFQIHIMMLDDEDYNNSVKAIIRNQKVNAEYAVSVTSQNFSEMFSAMDDHYMKARATDIRDISERIIDALEQKKGEWHLDKPSIICAEDLTPSETVLFDKKKILGFVTEGGSTNSHTAILARNMNIPAIIGVGESFLLNVKDGDTIGVDSSKGEIFVHPDEETVILLKDKERQFFEKRELLKRLKGKENVTLDGHKINIFANIASSEDIGAVLLSDAGGIGLFRSEFLYLEKNQFPSEKEQFEVYKKVLLSLSDKKVIIRTLDIGADKKLPYFSFDKEENAAMGIRGIRLCFEKPDIFKTQLKALYSASVFGKLGIMFPMISNLWEGEKILETVNEVKRELEREGIEYSKNVELGIMIETPAAALISDKLAKLFDFFSVGTNDLLQYTLACDRQNPKIDKYLDSHHEGVLKLIKMSADAIHKEGGWIGICGELASDLELTKTFLKMGIDELSVSPENILKLREEVRNIRL